MDKLQELNSFIIHYGYLAIFLFVFLQEMGVPNPFTNELVLLFSGYLTYTGVLGMTNVIIVSVSADFIGSVTLYFIFLLLSKRYISSEGHSSRKQPSRFTKFVAKFENLKQRLNKGKQWDIFLLRLTPFLRGYISVVAGVLQIKPNIFLTTVMLSAITWSAGLVLAGRLMAPYWNSIARKSGMLPLAGLIVLLIIALLIAGKYVVRKELSKNTIKDEPYPK